MSCSCNKANKPVFTFVTLTISSWSVKKYKVKYSESSTQQNLNQQHTWPKVLECVVEITPQSCFHAG